MHDFYEYHNIFQIISLINIQQVKLRPVRHREKKFIKKNSVDPYCRKFLMKTSSELATLYFGYKKLPIFGERSHQSGNLLKICGLSGNILYTFNCPFQIRETLSSAAHRWIKHSELIEGAHRSSKLYEEIIDFLQFLHHEQASAQLSRQRPFFE